MQRIEYHTILRDTRDLQISNCKNCQFPGFKKKRMLVLMTKALLVEILNNCHSFIQRYPSCAEYKHFTSFCISILQRNPNRGI